MDALLYFFYGFRWQDVLDILLNSYILFRLYILFRGTNVIRVLILLCILWAVSQAAVPLGLVITNWAKQGIITLAALIIIIVFRNEISFVLRTKNLKSFLWGIPKVQYRTAMNIIVDSVYELAEKKIGAIIVLPFKQGLESVVQEGIPIRGKLSQEMLVSIFWPDNPLHDGATIIQDERITSAGVILPLSNRGDLPSYFGTRHRAALGLTEVTDSVVIVISEESGRVSLFKENQSYNSSNRSTLALLLKKYAGDSSVKKRFKHQTIELAAAALISFFCVTGLWFSFSKGMETFATYEVPVEFMNPDQKMEIISSSASSIKLLISGAKPLINSIKSEQINVKLNLSRTTAGVNKISIIKENIFLPPGIRLKKIDPAELDITLDKLVEKEIPIQPHWIGKLPKGLIMKEAEALPRTVIITGGKMMLEKISTIFTEQILLDKITESGTASVGLIVSPASLRLKNNLKIEIRYIIAEKSTP